mmetsp:Transcript_28974/g.33316  ORF Transcript_28974/g.33316 Transcript_28974/m.33316 type:complete len:84 (-) Transcript_28974:187-438(-)
MFESQSSSHDDSCESDMSDLNKLDSGSSFDDCSVKKKAVINIYRRNFFVILNFVSRASSNVLKNGSQTLCRVRVSIFRSHSHL